MPDIPREGDQPLPTPNEHQDIQSMVIVDIAHRRVVGIERYGTALQPFNGRDGLQDAYEEALDLTMYLKQLIVERDIEVSMGRHPSNYHTPEPVDNEDDQQW